LLQVHQQQQQYGQAMPMVYQTGVQQQQQAAGLQQQPVACTSDNSGSGSYLLHPYSVPAQAGGAGMPSIQQRQQQAYMLSPQVMQPMLIQQQPSPSAVGLGMQQQGQVAQQLSRNPPDSSMVGPMVHLSLQVTASQFAVVSNQLYNISAMSGDDLTSAPVAAGLFHINVTGAQSQVTAARQLITSLLTQVG
jgi:hypothetical protein